jgi:hypothetical protein
MSFDIDLGQGDSDDVGVLLTENGIGSNLTGGTIKLSMKTDTGTKKEVTCLAGGIVNGVNYTLAQGGITIPFTPTETATPSVYRGKIIVSMLGSQATYPSGQESITVTVWEGI